MGALRYKPDIYCVEDEINITQLHHNILVSNASVGRVRVKDVDDVEIEYDYSLLAKDEGDGKRHFIIDRFDNLNNRSLHMHSFASLYNYNFDEWMDYDYLFRMNNFLRTKKTNRVEILELAKRYKIDNHKGIINRIQSVCKNDLRDTLITYGVKRMAVTEIVENCRFLI